MTPKGEARTETAFARWLDENYPLAGETTKAAAYSAWRTALAQSRTPEPARVCAAWRYRYHKDGPWFFAYERAVDMARADRNFEQEPLYVSSVPSASSDPSSPSSVSSGSGASGESPEAAGQDRANAARYRWLRDVVVVPTPLVRDGRTGWLVYEFSAPIAYGPNIDAAIDAAMKERP